MSASLRLRTFRGIKSSQELKLFVCKIYRKKHTNSWRNVKSATDLEVQCGDEYVRFSICLNWKLLQKSIFEKKRSHISKALRPGELVILVS